MLSEMPVKHDKRYETGIGLFL